jgi:two-component system response regulator FixJ
VNGRPVYVVDDEEPIQRSLQLMLRVIGFAPQAFGSGAEFLAAAPALAEGCVLLDLRMPDIDGLEVQRRLLASDKSAPVIVMSGHGDLAVGVSAMEQGAVAFLEKPFARSTLEHALRIGFQKLEDDLGYRDYLKAAAGAVQQLRPADRQVLELIARGHETDSIVQQTGLAPADLELARSRIFKDLGSDSLTDVLRIAFAARAAAAR